MGTKLSKKWFFLIGCSLCIGFLGIVFGISSNIHVYENGVQLKNFVLFCMTCLSLILTIIVWGLANKEYERINPTRQDIVVEAKQ